MNEEPHEPQQPSEPPKPRPPREPELEAPDDGQHCDVHEDRTALVICPKCHANACMQCFHSIYSCCHKCFVRAVPDLHDPIPFETTRSPATLFSSIGLLVTPRRNVPRFALGDVAPALTFFVCTFIPLAMLAGIVPFTYTITFGHGGEYAWNTTNGDTPATHKIALDFALAMGLGLFRNLLQFALLVAPLVQLGRTLGRNTFPNATLRAALYLGWILPALQLLQLTTLIATDQTTENIVATAISPLLLFGVGLLYWNLRLTTRIAHGTGPLASWFALLLAVFVSEVGIHVALEAAQPWLPSTPQIAAPQNTTHAPGDSRGNLPVQAPNGTPPRTAPRTEPSPPTVAPAGPGTV